MKRILVAGATGYLGRYVVKELKNQGYYIKVLVRHQNTLDQPGDILKIPIGKDVDEVVIGDLTKPETLKNVCENVDYVFSSIGITRQKEGLTFKDVDYQGNVNLLKEAEQSHVEKFMYIHVYIDDNWKEVGPLIEAKKRFVDLLISSNIHHIIIRPTGFFSDLTQFLSMAKKGRAYLIGDGKKKMNPIYGEDLARFCIQSFSETNRTFDIGGPEILTYEQIVRLAFNVLDQKEHITYIPVVLLKPISVGLRLFSKHHYGLFRFFMNVMTHNIIAPKYGKHKIRNLFNQLS